MILFIETSAGKRMHFKINSPEDLKPLYSMYPQAEEIFMGSSSLAEAVRSIAEYLNSHRASSWVEGDDDISKSLKGTALALGMAFGALLPAKSTHSNTTPSNQKPLFGQKAFKDTFGTAPEDRFLWTVKQIESSGGIDTDHAPIKHGRFRGERAIGKWGLLKPTINEIVTRMKVDGTLKPEHEALQHMSRDQLDSHFKANPHHELHMARYLARHVIGRQKGDTKRAAYAWLMGHNLFPKDISDDALRASDYVSKYVKISQKNPINPAKKQKPVITNAPSPSLNQVGHIAMKSESNFDFRIRLRNWKDERDRKKHDLMPKTTSFAPDPGRLRDPELDKKPAEGFRGKIEQSIKDHKK